MGIKELILFFICNILFVLSTVGYVKLFNINKTQDKIISGIITYFFRIIVYELILGYLIQKLSYNWITIVSIIEFIVMNILIYLIKKINFISYLKENIAKLKKVKLEVKFSFNSIIFSIFIVTFSIMAFVAIFIYEYSYDGNYYHLPHIIDYIQAGKIYLTNNTLWNNVYPQNMELLNMFYMMFTKSIVLVRMPQIIFSVLGIIVVYNLMKLIGFKKSTCFKASMLYFVTPVILAQLATTYLDCVVATCFLTLIYYLINILKENKLEHEIMYFLTLAIFMGLKGTCTIYAVVITSVYIGFKIYCLVKKKEKFSSIATKCVIFLIIVIFIGCTWMIQNIIVFKNPIHPFKFMGIDGLDANIDIGQENEPISLKNKSEGFKLLTSWIGLKSSDLFIDNGISISNLFQKHDSRVGGLGISWMYFLFPLTLVALVLVYKRKYKLNVYQIIIGSILIICFIVTPANWWGRYVGFISFLGFMGYGIIEEIIKTENKRKLLNIIYLFIFIGSIVFASKNAIQIFAYEKPYDSYNEQFTKYVNSDNGKNMIVLEESYYSTQYLVYLKGNHIQNRVDTYYIEEMYKNAQVKNHNIGSYENFCKIVNSYSNLDCIIILDASHNRNNSKYAEKYYNEVGGLTKKNYGEDIVVYEKVN